MGGGDVVGGGGDYWEDTIGLIVKIVSLQVVAIRNEVLVARDTI